MVAVIRCGPDELRQGEWEIQRRDEARIIETNPSLATSIARRRSNAAEAVELQPPIAKVGDRLLATTPCGQGLTKMD